MKVRGGRRRRDAEITRYWRAVKTIDWSGLASAFDGFMTGIGRAINNLAAAAERVVKAYVLSSKVTWWLSGQNARNRWVATHQLPAAVSPWAAPVQCTER